MNETPAAQAGCEAAERAQARTEEPEDRIREPEDRIRESEDRIRELEDRIRELETDAEARQDQYKRILAEYDNFRKRSAKEREGIHADVTAQTVSAFLPVLDNLERAAAREDASQGMQMIHKQFCQVLSTLKITPCATVGQAFDPNLHNAVMHVEEDRLGENVIAEVLMQGYTLNGRLVRAAMVKAAN